MTQATVNDLWTLCIVLGNDKARMPAP